MSCVGILCRSWCYIRKYERKEFIVCNISPCILCCAVTSIQGALKKWSLKWKSLCKILCKCKNMHAQAVLVVYHFRSFHSHTSFTLSWSIHDTNDDVHRRTTNSCKFILSSCVWYALASQWRHSKQTNLPALWKLDDSVAKYRFILAKWATFWWFCCELITE